MNSICVFVDSTAWGAWDLKKGGHTSDNYLVSPEKSPLSDEDFNDGLHPNATGHEKIFAKVREFLIEKGWI